jgi:hypothetical protein
MRCIYADKCPDGYKLEDPFADYSDLVCIVDNGLTFVLKKLMHLTSSADGF